MDTIYWHMNATQEGANCAYERLNLDKELIIVIAFNKVKFVVFVLLNR